jgi:hypothetical protein
MTDHLIIFSTPMVRALLREAERPGTGKTQTRRVLKAKSGVIAARSVLQHGLHWMGIEYDRSWPLRLPYAPGDRLYVRESHCVIDYRCRYRADEERFEPKDFGLRWRRSIHMPRWASRLTLTVTDVRVQRLQEISEADAVAEGYKQPPEGVIGWPPVGWFADLWNSLHGPGAWEANPWVAAYTFTVQRRNIDA